MLALHRLVVCAAWDFAAFCSRRWFVPGRYFVAAEGGEWRLLFSLTVACGWGGCRFCVAQSPYWTFVSCVASCRGNAWGCFSDRMFSATCIEFQPLAARCFKFMCMPYATVFPNLISARVVRRSLAARREQKIGPSCVCVCVCARTVLDHARARFQCRRLGPPDAPFDFLMHPLTCCWVCRVGSPLFA